jgi:hypothetical protein
MPLVTLLGSVRWCPYGGTTDEIPRRAKVPKLKGYFDIG